MSVSFDRRALVLASPAFGLAMLGFAAPASLASATEPAASGAWPGFFKQNPELVSKVVGLSHRDEAGVRELIDRHPALVNAWWDWGFGDWESPLGAAAHTGRRNIAALLISRGARVDIFAATMLGWLDTVKAFVAASPGVQRTLGPHGITLLSHARAGGEQSKAVLEYLEALGDADTGPAVLPLAEESRAAYEGVYVYGPAEADRFTIRAAKTGLEFAKGDLSVRLHQVGQDEFFPAGVPSVRFRFTLGDARYVEITDHDLRVTATLSRP
jgi:hypothetical protein